MATNDLPTQPQNLADALGQLTKQYGTQAIQDLMDQSGATNDMKTEPATAGLTATGVVPGSTPPKLGPDGGLLSPVEAFKQASMSADDADDEMSRLGVVGYIQEVASRRP